jgi:hypothetical protein
VKGLWHGVAAQMRHLTDFCVALSHERGIPAVSGAADAPMGEIRTNPRAPEILVNL